MKAELEAAKAVLRGDGCTSAPDLWWRACCDEHDDAYGRGVPRGQADFAFLRCLKKRARTLFGRHFLSYVYFLFVRKFGHKYYAKARPET